MTLHSPKRKSIPLLQGLTLLHRGKVRDTYQLTEELLLSMATDAISIYDFVLNALIPGKGIILNAMNHFWSMYLSQFGIKTHLVAAGVEIDQYLPEHLRHNLDLQARAIVIRKHKMAPVEFIGRLLLTGSGFKDYQKTGKVFSHVLPAGLQDGDQLPYILDTPTTKAEMGHDEPLPPGGIFQRYPQQTKLLLETLGIGHNHAQNCGIKLVDTKLEFSEDGILCDEILTPDSSRYWSLKDWEDSRKKSERSACEPYDKELVRNEGKKHGIDKLKDPENPEQVTLAHAFNLSEYVIKQTVQTYRYIFWRLTGKNIDNYLRDVLHMDMPLRAKEIVILCGSKSDWDMIKSVVSSISLRRARITVDMMSCHRNPIEVSELAKYGCPDKDAVICVGGKAFALPGVFDAFAHANGNDQRVIGVALGEPGTKAFEAAKLSIEELPIPVIMDEITGDCYKGNEGLLKAIDRVIDGELPPQQPRVQKPVERSLFKNY